MSNNDNKTPCCPCCTSTGKPHNPTNWRTKAFCCRAGRGACDCRRPLAPLGRAPEPRNYRSSHEHKSALGRYKKAAADWESLDPQDRTWARTVADAKGHPACQAAAHVKAVPKVAAVDDDEPDVPKPAPTVVRTAWDDSDDETPVLPEVPVQTRAEAKAPVVEWDPRHPETTVGPHGRPLVIVTRCGIERLDDKSWAVMGDIEDALNEGQIPYELEDVYDGPVPAPVEDAPAETKVEDAPAETKVEDAPAETKVEDAPAETKVEDAPAETKVEDAPELTDEQQREFEAFVAEQEMPPPMVFWYPQVNLPKSTVVSFADEELFPKLCDFCRTLQNLVFKPEGGLAQTLCLSCRTVVGLHPGNHCHSGHAVCETFRFVGPIGDVAPLCRACHQYEEGLRRTRRNGQRNGKSRGGSGFPLSAYIK